MARLGRSNNRLDSTVLVACAVLSLIALVLPTQVREPIASGLRRGILAPMLRLQQRAEESRRAFPRKRYTAAECVTNLVSP